MLPLKRSGDWWSGKTASSRTHPKLSVCASPRPRTAGLPSHSRVRQVPFLVEAQAASQRRFVAGFLCGDLPQQALQLRIVALLGQGQVTLPGLGFVADGQFDGLNDVQFGLGFVLRFGLVGCHSYLRAGAATSISARLGLGNYITIFWRGKKKLRDEPNLFHVSSKQKYLVHSAYPAPAQGWWGGRPWPPPLMRRLLEEAGTEARPTGSFS